MRRRQGPAEGDLLGGTLDMLVLRTLQPGPAHGLEIAQRIEQRSDDVLLVEQGSLYPALHRLERQRLVTASWGVSANNRKAKFYRLTARGHGRLAAEESRWAALVSAVARVLRPAD